MDILASIRNLSNEVQVTIGVVAGVVILGFFVWQISKNFTIGKLVASLLTAGLAGWAVASGIGWFRDQLGGTVNSVSSMGDPIVISALTAHASTALTLF